jgi:hypothetical protein
VVRLLAESSVVVLVIAFGWWGMWSVGSDTLSSQSDSLTTERATIYVGGCADPARLMKSSVRAKEEVISHLWMDAGYTGEGKGAANGCRRCWDERPRRS